MSAACSGSRTGNPPTFPACRSSCTSTSTATSWRRASRRIAIARPRIRTARSCISRARATDCRALSRSRAVRSKARRGPSPGPATPCYASSTFAGSRREATVRTRMPLRRGPREGFGVPQSHRGHGFWPGDAPANNCDQRCLVPNFCAAQGRLPVPGTGRSSRSPSPDRRPPLLPGRWPGTVRPHNGHCCKAPSVSACTDLREASGPPDPTRTVKWPFAAENRPITSHGNGAGRDTFAAERRLVAVTLHRRGAPWEQRRRNRRARRRHPVRHKDGHGAEVARTPCTAPQRHPPGPRPPGRRDTAPRCAATAAAHRTAEALPSSRIPGHPSTGRGDAPDRPLPAALRAALRFRTLT